VTTVSVVIPTYNRASCLADSVGSVLAQTRPPLEVLVVDDGSTDDTAEVCARFPEPVRCLAKANGGVSSARNLGLGRARGEFVALLDADDVWPPEKLEVQLAVHEAFPEVGWSITGHRTTDRSGRELPGLQGFVRDFPAFAATGLAPEDFFARTMERREVTAAGRRHVVFVGDAYPLLFDGNFVFPSCAMVRRDVAARAGAWDETFRVANDTEWFHRVGACASCAVVLTPLMRWRRGRQDTLMQGRHVVALVRNAVTSLDRALLLRGDPVPATVAAHAAGRRRLLRRLAYAELSVGEGAAARATVREARRWGVALTPRLVGIWVAGLLPPAALRALGTLKARGRRLLRGTVHA
jgi:glycosyltransferase involved in cell wall biosynthesis